MSASPAMKTAAPAIAAMAPARLHLKHSLSLPCNPTWHKAAILALPTSSYGSYVHKGPIFDRKASPLVAMVARTSDWAQQEEENEAEVGAEGPLSDWGEESEDLVGEVVGSGENEEEGGYVEPPEDAKLYVGNLPYDMDSEGLAKLFERAGVVEIAEVIYNRSTGQSRGFGFVSMSTVEEAEKAVELLHRYDCNRRLLNVNKAVPRGSTPEREPREFESSYRIYVGNLPWQVDDLRLEQIFSEHGKVVDARVVYDRHSGRSRGFGFVTMSSQTEQDDAIAALDGQTLDGRALKVNVAEQRSQRPLF